MNRRSGFFCRGVTLVETLVATAASTAMLAGLMTGAVALQRGFSAVDHQVTSQEDQMRVIDYITRDLQRASTAQVSNSGRMLTLSLPDQNDVPNLPIHTPVLLNGVVSYGGTPATVSYYIEGADFVRMENSTRTVISTKIEEFFISISGSLATFQLAFTPQFSRRDPATRRDGARLSTTVYLRNLGLSR